MPLVTNISEMAIRIGPSKIRPGKSEFVSADVLNDKHYAMHGKMLWFGALPENMKRAKEVPVESVSPMTTEEVRAYLESLPISALASLCTAMSPPLVFDTFVPHSTLVTRLTRVLFSDRVLDPEQFFWLRRWTKQGITYIAKE
jgi:hypothetical protein